MCERDLPANNRTARQNREQFREQRVIAVHLTGSPASGKTTLLEATARFLRAKARVGIVAADLTSDDDAVRLRAAGADAVGAATGASRHLDADLVQRALRTMPWSDLDYLFLEDAGNLALPSMVDLGEDLNVVALSVTEGAEEPLKYPTIFEHADLVLLTKVDLLPQVERATIDRVRESVAAVMVRPALLTVSARTGAGIQDWVRWLRSAGARRGAPCALGVVGM